MLACVGCKGGWEDGLYLQLGSFPGFFSLHAVQLGKKLTLSSLLPLLVSLFSHPSSFSFPLSPLSIITGATCTHTTHIRNLEAELSSETTLQPPTSPQPPASPHSDVGERESTPISVVDSSSSKQHSPTPTAMVRVSLSGLFRLPFDPFSIDSHPSFPSPLFSSFLSSLLLLFLPSLAFYLMKPVESIFRKQSTREPSTKWETLSMSLQGIVHIGASIVLIIQQFCNFKKR